MSKVYWNILMSLRFHLHLVLKHWNPLALWIFTSLFCSIFKCLFLSVFHNFGVTHQPGTWTHGEKTHKIALTHIGLDIDYKAADCRIRFTYWWGGRYMNVQMRHRGVGPRYKDAYIVNKNKSQVFCYCDKTVERSCWSNVVCIWQNGLSLKTWTQSDTKTWG